jgi:hypothetical protein
MKVMGAFSSASFLDFFGYFYFGPWLFYSISSEHLYFVVGLEPSFL